MGLAELLNVAYDQGVTFLDAADQYASHPCLPEALKTVPREKAVILTTTNSTTANEVKADLERFRRELGTDYIDILLLHCIADHDWNRTLRGPMDVISTREKGIVRSHGTSCHTHRPWELLLPSLGVEVDLAIINPHSSIWIRIGPADGSLRLAPDEAGW